LKRFSKIFPIKADVDMFYPIVAPHNPQGPWCEQFWIYIISASFRVNMTFYGTVVHEKKMFKWPFHIFALFMIISLWRGLDLHLNKREFPSCKKCLYQIWLKLARCFILKDSFQYRNTNIVSPLVSPTLTLGDHNLYMLKSATMSESFHLNMSYSGSVVLKERNFQWLRQFFAFLWLSPL
jgi:hypothetical protein